MDKTCSVCQKKGLSAYGDWKWNVYGIEYRMALCNSCGSAFTTPLPDDALLKKIYGSSFDYRWYKDHYNAKISDCRVRLTEYRSIMGKRVLDFGGGMGYFSELARKDGFESVTYDPYIDSNIPEGIWDTLVSLHMLEHSNNLDKTIELMKSLLGPGGNIILAVPNFACKGYSEQGMYWVWAQPPFFHIFHFTAVGLKSLLERHGFKDIKISYHERWDANLYTDLKNVNIFRKLDAAWGKKPFNSFVTYRKMIAKGNSYLRFKGLEKALQGYTPENEIFAELQVTATRS